MATKVEESFSFATWTAVAAETDFTIPFGYLDKSHINVSVDGVRKLQNVDFTIPGAYFQTGGGTVEFVTPMSGGEKVKIWRSTKISQLQNDYTNGAVLTGDNLQQSHLQHLYLMQELNDAVETGVPGTGDTGVDIIINIVGGTPDPIPGSFDKDDVLVFLNGLLLHPDDFTLTPGASTTTIAVTNPDLEDDDVLLIRVLRSGGILNVDIGSITTGAIVDGAVTGEKIADDALLYKHGGNTWAGAGPAVETDGLSALLDNLNSRLAVLEGTTISGTQIERKEVAVPGTSTPFSVSFSFAPDYVLMVHSTDAAAGSTEENSGASFLIKTGESSKAYEHYYGNPPGRDLFTSSVALSGTSLSGSMYSTCTVPGKMHFIGIKE